MNVELIHKPGREKVVPDALSRQDELQALNMTQTLWLVYKGERNLQHKSREVYINNLKTQRLLGELRKGKALKKVKLVKRLL